MKTNMNPFISFAAVAGLLLVGTLPLFSQTPLGGGGTRSVAVLACQYSDKPNTYGFTPASILAGSWMPNNVTTNGVTSDNSISGLIQDASGGTLNIQGTQAFGWFTLPNPLSFYSQYPYGTGSTDGTTMAGSDCIAAAQNSGVNLTPFTYVAIYFNDALGSGAQGESWTAKLPGPASPTNLNVLAVNQHGLDSPALVLHEFGHILSNGGYHTTSISDPLGSASYGDDPMNPFPGVPLRYAYVSPEWDASKREQMGFIPQASIVTFTGGTQTYSISRLTQPLPGLPTVIEVPLPGGNKYVISARTYIGYDARPVLAQFAAYTIGAEGVRIELPSSSADTQLEMSTPGGDPSSTDAVWLTGQTYTDSANGITISVVNFNSTGTPTAQITVSAAAKPDVYAVNSGGGAVAPFSADLDYSGGSTSSTAAAIDTSGVTNPAPQAVYQSERYGNLTYTFPNLTAGANYTVRLHFAEIYWTAAGQRVFNVSINGNQVLSNFDIFATTGAKNKAIVEQFTATANASGQIVIQYTTVVDNAKSSGIEIAPQ